MLKRNILHLLFLVLFSTSIRLVGIGRESLWFDEAVSYLASQQTVPDIFQNLIQSSHPPLYYLFLHYWLVIFPKESDATARILSLLFNVLSLPVIYLLCLDLFHDKKTALLSILLVSISPFHVFYSRELRMYTQLMFFVVMGLFAYVRAEKVKRWYWWILFFVSFLIAVYTHLFAFLALAGVNIYAFLKKGRQNFLLTLSISAVVAFCFLPWVYTLLSEVQKELGSFRPLTHERVLNPIKLLTTLSYLTFGPSNQPLYSGLAFFIIISLPIFLLLELKKGWVVKIDETLNLPFSVIVCCIGIPLIGYLFYPFFLPERVMASASPFIFIVISWGFFRLKKVFPILVIAMIGVMLYGTVNIIFFSEAKPPYRSVLLTVNQLSGESDVVLHLSDFSLLPALRYNDHQEQVILEGNPDLLKPTFVFQELGGRIISERELTDAESRIWVIDDEYHHFDWQNIQMELITKHKQKKAEYVFRGITLYLFQNSDSKSTY